MHQAGAPITDDLGGAVCRGRSCRTARGTADRLCGEPVRRHGLPASGTSLATYNRALQTPVGLHDSPRSAPLRGSCHGQMGRGLLRSPAGLRVASRSAPLRGDVSRPKSLRSCGRVSFATCASHQRPIPLGFSLERSRSTASSSTAPAMILRRVSSRRSCASRCAFSFWIAAFSRSRRSISDSSRSGSTCFESLFICREPRKWVRKACAPGIAESAPCAE